MVGRAKGQKALADFIAGKFKFGLEATHAYDVPLLSFSN